MALVFGEAFTIPLQRIGYLGEIEQEVPRDWISRIRCRGTRLGWEDDYSDHCSVGPSRRNTRGRSSEHLSLDAVEAVSSANQPSIIESIYDDV